MFENLDDPGSPTPAPLDDVVARGRRLRAHRRMLAGAACMFALAGVIVAGAVLQGDPHHKVVISNGPPSTAPDTTAPDTAAPDVSTTTIATAATTTTTPSPSSTVDTTIPAPSAVDATTSTTQPPHDPSDFSKVTVSYPENPIWVVAGTTRSITYTVTNSGTWDVDLPASCYGPSLWAQPATSAWAPYTEGIWPQPFPTRGTSAPNPACASTLHTLTPGQSMQWYDQIVAGYADAAGHIMPSPPGFTSYRPSFLPQCAQPCAPSGPDAVAVTIGAPTWPPPTPIYTITVTTLHPQAAPGASADVGMTYTNGLAFTVRMPLFGPCWTVKSGTATVDCTGSRPAVIIGPHQTVDLVGTIWARSGFGASGAPLAPGRYRLDLGDLQGTSYALGDPFPYLTVS